MLKEGKVHIFRAFSGGIIPCLLALPTLPPRPAHGGNFCQQSPLRSGQQFQLALQPYIDIREQVSRKIPALGRSASAAETQRRQESLAVDIRAERSGTKQGEIVSRSLRDEFEAVLSRQLRGPYGDEIKEMVRETNPDLPEVPGHVDLAVHAVHPSSAPVTTMPPALLECLPDLPSPPTYRFLGRALILLDEEAAPIVDYLPELLPRGILASPEAKINLDDNDGVRLPGFPNSVSFGVIGDSGTGGESQYEIAAEMAEFRDEYPFEFVLMLGDNMYGLEWDWHFRRKFERPYEELLSAGVEFYAVLGNHDGRGQIHYEPFNMDG